MSTNTHLNTDTLEPSRDHAAGRIEDLVTRAASQVESITRHGIERARHAQESLRLQAEHTGQRTVGYVRDEPVKAVLIAVAAGAALAALLSVLSRRN